MEIEDDGEKGEPEIKEKQQGNYDKVLIDNLVNEIKSKKIMSSITTSHKEYYAFLSKLGKTIDKNFKYSDEIENIFNKDLDKQLIDQLIFNHMIQEGYFEAQDKLAEEANLNKNEELCNHF